MPASPNHRAPTGRQGDGLKKELEQEKQQSQNPFSRWQEGGKLPEVLVQSLPLANLKSVMNYKPLSLCLLTSKMEIKSRTMQCVGETNIVSGSSRCWKNVSSMFFPPGELCSRRWAIFLTSTAPFPCPVAAVMVSSRLQLWEWVLMGVHPAFNPIDTPGLDHWSREDKRPKLVQ